MAYAPPSIGPQGLSVPVYSDIVAQLVSEFQGIYGQNSYLAIDSADYQWISTIAAKVADLAQAVQLVYNARSPQTAVGSGLDGLVKLNGIVRKSASFSTAQVTVSGTANTQIINGIVQDINGFSWSLPASVSIPGAGSVIVTATCQSPGAIAANPGDISIISTPTSGWTSSTNASVAILGQPVETDSELRARQALSVALPSITMLQGTIAGIAATVGVTRYAVYENYFGYTATVGVCNTSGTAVTVTQGYPLDSSMVAQSMHINGTSYTISAIGSTTTATLSTTAGTLTGASFYVGNGTSLGPAHSITVVVEGGANTDVAQTIYNNRGIGCLTNGTTSVTVTDPLNGNFSMPIAFYRPTYVPVFVSLSIHSLTGFTSSTQAAIQTAIVNYLNSLQIGQSVILSELYGAALSVRPNPDQPMFSIRALTLGISASPSGTSDINIAFSAVAQGVTANVVITLV